MSGEIIQLNDANFDEKIQERTPILVDFWAAWCAPCKMIAPTLESLAGEYAGRVRIGKLNVDENGATASRYGIQSIPTLILFKDGAEADKMIGVAAKDAISQMVEKHL
jgi:thioredoxin 1